MPDSAPCPTPSLLDAVVLQQLIAAAAEKARARKKTGPVALPPPVPASEKRAAALTKRLNRVRSLLEKMAGDVRRFDEARNRESRSLNPARRLGRRNSDKQLARLFSRIEQALQSAPTQRASNNSTPAKE